MQHNKAILLMLTSLLCAHNTTHSYVPTNDNGLFFAAGVMTAGAIGVVVAGYAHSHLRKDHNGLYSDVHAQGDGLLAQLKELKKQNAKQSEEFTALQARLASIESANTKEAKDKEDQTLFTRITLHIASASEANTNKIIGLQRDLNGIVPKVARLETSEQSSQATLKKLNDITTKELADKATVDALATRIGSLDERFKTLDVQVQGLNKINTDAVKKAQDEWETLKKDFSTARAQVDKYLQNAANINKQVTDLTSNYQATSRTVEGLRKQLQDDHANAAQEALKQIKNLEQRVDALEKHKAESAAASTDTTASATATPVTPLQLPENTAAQAHA